MRNWFKENLPFTLRKYFPNIPEDDVDNNFKGIGLHMGFDKRLSSFYLTKLDYKPKVEGIRYDTTAKEFFINKERIYLTDTKYFCNKSWTVSYSFLLKGWSSFHSFKPNFYTENVNNFESGIQTGDCEIWSHGLTNKSYQVIYGVREPFIVEYTTTQSGYNNFINSIEFTMDAIRYHNDNDYFYNNNVHFNKAVIYNDKQTSGNLNLIKSDPDDMSQFIEFPRVNPTSTDILISNSENFWRFNDFFDISKSEVNNLPIMTYDCANVNKEVNQKAVDQFKPDFDKGRLRHRQNRIRLTQDKYTNYKLILMLNFVNQNVSLR